MKKISVLLFMVFVVTSGLRGQEATGEPLDNHPGTQNLLLTHPTAHNLRVMVSLLEQDLIELKDYRLVGVYHHKERYDYGRSKAFIDTLNYDGPEIFLKELGDSISPDMLYRDNPLTDDFRILFRQSQGVVFFGGPDMPPQVYGGKTHLLTSVYDPYRHYFELSFLYHLLGGLQSTDYEELVAQDPDYLIYGFCLGMQTMNVATGGSLVQDIPWEIYGLDHVEDILKLDRDRLHRNYNNRLSMDEDLLSGHFHRVHFTSAALSESWGVQDFHPLVYSNHHQAVDEVGKGLQVTATSMDGKIIEGLRHRDYGHVIGVQFHPEALFLYDSTARYRMAPPDRVSFTGPGMLKKARSMNFHRRFWRDFNRRLNGQ